MDSAAQHAPGDTEPVRGVSTIQNNLDPMTKEARKHDVKVTASTGMKS